MCASGLAVVGVRRLFSVHAQSAGGPQTSLIPRKIDFVSSSIRLCLQIDDINVVLELSASTFYKINKKYNMAQTGNAFLARLLRQHLGTGSVADALRAEAACKRCVHV